MNISVEKLPKCLASLRVEIPADKVTGERNRILGGYASKARIPGFRPGKAPQAVIERRFHKEITEELESTLIQAAYDEALKQEALRVLDFGIPEKITIHPDGTLTFHATLTLAPELTLPEYKAIPVRIPSATINEENVDRYLDNLRERFADYADAEPRPTVSGDTVVIDFSTTLDGKPIQETIGKPAGYLDGREAFWVKLDDESFLPGFAAAALGMSPGDQREFNLTMPADFPLADLREREIAFSVTLRELKNKVLPDADEEFAGKVTQGKSLAELRDIIRDRLTHELTRQVDDMKVNQIVQFLDAKVDMELPDSMLTEETQSQADAMVEQGLRAGMTEEEIEAQQAGLFGAASEQARTNLKTNFILQEIARAEKIAVTDQELIRHLSAAAQSNKQPAKQYIRDLQRSGRLPGIRNALLSGKTIDFLVEHASVEEITETETTPSHE